MNETLLKTEGEPAADPLAQPVSSPLRRFIREHGDPSWRLRASELAEMADRLYSPGGISSTEPYHFPDGSIGIASIHQRSVPMLVGGIFVLLLGMLLLFRVILPNLGTDDDLGAFTVFGFFVSFGLIVLAQFAKSPGADAVLVIDSLGGYAAWRTGFRLWSTQAVLSWQNEGITFEFVTLGKYSSQHHFIRALRAKPNGQPRLLFSARLDPLSRACWLKFTTAAESFLDRSGSQRP